MDFTDTRINSSDTLISSYQDVNLRRQQGNYSSLDYDLLRLRSQIFEAVYRKTDLIRANHELSHERDALKRRNRKLEAELSEVEMIKEKIKRDLEVSRERVSELEGGTKEKSVRSVDDRLSKSIGGKEEYNNSRTVLELVKEVEAKVETVMEKKMMELSTSVELLEDENRDMSVLLRAALSEKHTAEKQLKETSEQKRWALMQIAERGLQRIGFGFGVRESVQESSEMGNLGNDDESEEGEQNGVVIAIEKTIKNLRKEISQLKLSLEESRLDQERLKKFSKEQAQKLEENAMYIDKLQNRDKFLTQNVEELVKVIREAESEVSRWREACELEVEAGQREVEERNQLIAVLKAEVEKKRSALVISEGKLKLKEELAKAAMVAEEAAEKTMRLAERRITELLSRIEHLYRQLEEAESTERRRRKCRYIWCWPLWRFPTAASGVTAIDDSSCISSRALLRYDV